MEKILNWYTELEETLETTTEPISFHDFYMISFKTNMLIDSHQINKIMNEARLNHYYEDDFTEETKKVFWELEKHIINNLATETELKEYNNLNNNLSQDLLVFEIIQRNQID